MTKELYETLKRAFETDCPPTLAVGLTQDERVYVVAEIYESYSPAMPEGERNRGYECTSIAEMVDHGMYCGLKFVKSFWSAASAMAEFRKMANEQGMKCASNAKSLKRLLKTVTCDYVRKTA